MIYVKTAAGRQALKERSELMPRKFHFPFLMCDGSHDAADIVTACASHGVTLSDLQQMEQQGFIEPVAGALAGSHGAALEEAAPQGEGHSFVPPSPNATALVEAHRLATAMTAKLGLRGFRLNLAVEAASSLEDFRALLPKLEEAVGTAAAKPLAELLGSAGVWR